MAKQSEKNKRLTLWIDKEIKEQGDKIIYDLGLTPSSVINLLYRQIVNQRAIPFDVKLPEIIMAQWVGLPNAGGKFDE